MHELAITEGILRTAVPKAEQSGAKKILEIRLSIGELSGVIPEYVQYYFDLIGKGTIAEGAKIVAKVLPVAVSCPDCGYEGGIDRKDRRCPECRSTRFRITGGREFYVDSLLAE